MRFAYSFLLAIAFFVSGQPQSPAPAAHPPTAHSKSSKQTMLEQQLRDADIEFCKQTAARRLDGWMDFFADDASSMQNGKTVGGKAELRKYYEQMFAVKEFTLTWTPTHAEAAKDGTLGYTYGTYEAKTGSDVSRGMYLTIWRRVNGKWKVIMDTGSALRQQP
jgi:ketosteroid isomerase-like protein